MFVLPEAVKVGCRLSLRVLQLVTMKSTGVDSFHDKTDNKYN